MLTNHQLRDLTRGLRQSEPSKSPLNVILSAENPRKWILRFAQYDKAHGALLFKSNAKGNAPPFHQKKRRTATAGFCHSEPQAKNPHFINGFFANAQNDKTARQDKSRAQKQGTKATPRRELVAFRKNKALKLLRQELSTSET